MRFLGTIEAKIDDKGRAFLPASMRKMMKDAVKERMVMRRDLFQPCLVLYPEDVWNRQMDSLRQRLNRWNKAHQQLFRSFVAEAEPIVLDGTGRLLIPRRCKEQIGIGQDIRFIGMGDTIEIWAAEKADEVMGDADGLGSVLEELMEGMPDEPSE